MTNNAQFLFHSPNCAYSHRSGLMTFKFTQLLFLADRDILYYITWIMETDQNWFLQIWPKRKQGRK